jgi:hypothetical protein
MCDTKRTSDAPARAVMAVLLFAVLAAGSGCATSRGILNINIEPHKNPDSGKAVKIARVTDIRAFEEKPRDPSIPSLKGAEIDDKSITSRAIARKRNTYGKALGDVLLPEGSTVEGLIGDVVANSFRDAGYNVLRRDDPGYANALPVEVDVEQFWSWMMPGFWSLSLECESRVKIKAPVAPFENGGKVRGYVILHTQGAGSRQWQNTIEKGIADLGKNITERLTTGRVAE